MRSQLTGADVRPGAESSATMLRAMLATGSGRAARRRRRPVGELPSGRLPGRDEVPINCWPASVSSGSSMSPVGCPASGPDGTRTPASLDVRAPTVDDGYVHRRDDIPASTNMTSPGTSGREAWVGAGGPAGSLGRVRWWRGSSLSVPRTRRR